MKAGDIILDISCGDSEKDAIFIVNEDLKTADDAYGLPFEYPINAFKKKYNTSFILRNDLRNKYFKGR